MFELNHSYLTITSYYVVNYEQLSDLIFCKRVTHLLGTKFSPTTSYDCYNYGYLRIEWGHWTHANRKQSLPITILFLFYRSIHRSRDWGLTHNNVIITSLLHHNDVIIYCSVQTKIQLIVLIFLLFNNTTIVSFFILFRRQFHSPFPTHLSCQL